MFGKEFGGIVEKQVVEQWQSTLLKESENWGIIELTWMQDFSKKKASGFIKMTDYRPFCPYTVDLEDYKEGRRSFTTDEWINILISAADYNPDAVAVELGSIRITAGEIEESYNYYISMLESYYGVEVTDDESILEYREMAITDLIHYYMPQWKAEQLGVTLTVEEEAEIARSASEQTEQLRSDLICEYAYYYGGTEEQVDDVSLLTEEQYNLAMEQINAELTEYFYAGYTLEDYLSEQYANSIDDSRTTKLIEKLES